MRGKKLEKKEDFYVTETKIPVTIQEEEKYNLNEKDVEVLPEGSIKYELNLIEFPIFSKDKKIAPHTSKKYTFSEKTNEYLEVVPSADQSDITKKILQEFDEQIFYGLLRIYEETGDRVVISNYSELLKISGIKYNSRIVHRVKDSLQRMFGCSIKFNKCFFYKTEDGLNQKLNDLKRITLLSSLRNLSLEDDDSKYYKKYFEKHGNIKEIFVATLNEDIIKNMDNKLHKYFKIEDLTEIKNATARKIYIMLTKWRYWQKDNPMRRTSRFLASRIPLSWKKSNIPQTIRGLEKACQNLKELGKIQDFKINKEGKLENSTIDFYFENKKDVLEKLNSKIGTEETGHEYSEIERVEERAVHSDIFENISDAEIIKEYSQEVHALYESLPFFEQIDIRKRDLDELLKEHSFEMLKADIEYCKTKSIDNFCGYFTKSCMSGHYSSAEVEKQKIREELQKKKVAREEKLKIEEEENKKEIRLKVEELYEKLSEEEIEKYHKIYKEQENIYTKTNVDLKMFIILRIEQEFEM